MPGKIIKHPVKCIHCGILDQNSPGHVGTDKTMKCPDCHVRATGEYVAMCRECCPTGHGTRQWQLWSERHAQ